MILTIYDDSMSKSLSEDSFSQTSINLALWHNTCDILLSNELPQIKKSIEHMVSIVWVPMQKRVAMCILGGHQSFWRKGNITLNLQFHLACIPTSPSFLSPPPAPNPNCFHSPLCGSWMLGVPQCTYSPSLAVAAAGPPWLWWLAGMGDLDKTQKKAEPIHNPSETGYLCQLL